ncbi:hypothetical protein ACLMAJ_24685 [Nocardia sp. KC 131]
MLRRDAAVKPVPTPPIQRRRPPGTCPAKTRPPNVVALAPLPGAAPTITASVVSLETTFVHADERRPGP